MAKCRWTIGKGTFANSEYAALCLSFSALSICTGSVAKEQYAV